MMLYALPLLAGSIQLNGLAKSYAGKKLVIFFIEDYLSSTKSVAGIVEIPLSGQFRTTIISEVARELILSIGSMEATLHVIPGNEYIFEIPPPSTDAFRRFDHTPVELNFPGAGDNEVNLLVRAYNQDHARFINDHFYQFAVGQYKGSEAYQAQMAAKERAPDMVASGSVQDTAAIVIKEELFSNLVEAFVARVHEKYGRYYNTRYLRDYIRYSLAELELMAGYKRQSLYREYLANQPVQLGHPSYMKFIQLFYSGTVTDPHQTIRKELMTAIHTEKSGQRIVELYATDSLYADPTLRTLAVIKGLRDARYSTEYPRAHLEECLSDLAKHAESEELRLTAGNTLSHIRRSKAGSALEDFVLLDEKNDVWRWSENTGEFTYILFFADWCSSCKKEMLVMERLRRQYPKFIRFVAINMDEDYEAFRNYISTNKDQRPVFLFGGNDPLLRQKFSLRAIPHAVLVDQEGRIKSDYTLLPGEGIQQEFEKISRALTKSSGGGTWKDK